MSLLEVEDLTVRYEDDAVVDGVSFKLRRGESVGLVGESGSGKSQTALAILGLLTKSARISGSIRYRGTELIGAADSQLNEVRARGIGIVFQDPMQALNPYLRIGRQLGEILVRHGLAARTEAAGRVTGMLQKVGLPDAERLLRAWPHELSGGMRQRVMIAAALIAEPRLLIADEPTTALDVTVQAQILDLLEDIRDDTALLLITHDLGVVAGRCERMLVMEHGRVVDQGPTTALFRSPGHAHTRTLLAAAPRIDSGEFPTQVTGSTMLAVDKASVRYGDRQRLAAVSDVSFVLRRGETVAVVGESGSGKASLVRAMLGLVPMHGGRVVFAGEALAGPIERRGLAQRRDLQLVFQDPLSALNPEMRVARIVEEPLVVHEPAMGKTQRRARLLEVLGRVGLGEEYFGRYPHQLSGGEAQRVAIARALILAPKVLVCDEAVAALDGSVRQQVLALLREVQRDSGLSIIFISHDLAVVRSLSHRVLVMYMGRLVEQAENAAIFCTPRHPYTRALLDSVPVPDPVVSPRRAPLRGEVGSVINPPGGCVFHPRCRHAVERCATQLPAMRDLAGTRVACHRAEELSPV